MIFNADAYKLGEVLPSGSKVTGTAIVRLGVKGRPGSPVNIVALKRARVPVSDVTKGAMAGKLITI